MNRIQAFKIGGRYLGLALLTASSAVFSATETTGTSTETIPDYREPSATVTALLTAPTPPEPLLHARSGQIALLYREPVIELERLTRPRLGLAGFRFDPESQTSGVNPLISRIEVISAYADPELEPTV
ncbi:MAG TPA: hypothetical protein VI566_09620, partial [Xanthomonadales bacterium]|nr:hypothetical protein [Xanthomonadales bacterium]